MEGAGVDLAHVVMGGGIVFGAYRNPELAHAHARCLTGATVAAVDLNMVDPALRACIEILYTLPADIARDLELAEWNDDDETPIDDEPLSIDDIDDA